VDSRGVESADHARSFGGNRGLEDPQARWKDDQGDADPLLVESLASGDPNHVMYALRTGRLFIALARSTIQPDIEEKTAEMAVVCMTASDGRLGLLGFTSVDSLTRWNPHARPVPITGMDAAVAALDESAQALLIDIAGPHPYTITLPDLVHLSGVDQRARALPLLRDALAGVGVESHIEAPGSSGPVQITAPAAQVDTISALLAGRSDIHAYTPEGISLVVSDGAS